MTSATATDARLDRYALTLAGLAGLATAAAYALMVQPGQGWTPARVALAAGLAGGYFSLQRRGFVLHWRDQRVISTLDEPVVFLALGVLPFPSAIGVVFAGTLFAQAVARRKPVKSMFNVAAYTLAATVASGVFLLAQARLDPIVAALPAVASYTIASNLLVASVFAKVEQAPYWRVFRERFFLATALHGPLGGAFGFVAYVLWSYHPVALLVLVPLAALALSFTKLNAGAEREALVRRRLADMSSDLIGTTNDDRVAKHILDACGELFLAGRVVLTLHDEHGGRTWSRDFEGFAEHGGRDPITAPVVGRGGVELGSLTVHPTSRAKELLDDHDKPLVAIVASRAASAIESARAFRETVELKNLHEGIVQNVPAGVIRVDGAGRILQTNPYLLAFLGHAPEPRRRTSIYEWDALLAMPDLLARVRHMLEAGEAFYDVEVDVGTDRRATLSASGVPLRATAGGAPLGGIVLFSDLTAHKEAEAAARSQSLTRPFVRRLVLSLVSGLHVPPNAIAEIGRSLARDLPQGTPADYAQAFRAMGLGNLHFDRTENGNYVFLADDLLEKRSKSPQPTCHLARGFLEGAIAHLHGGSSLGSEVRCQSQGHARCQFVVQPRAASPPQGAKLTPRTQIESPVKKSMK